MAKPEIRLKGFKGEWSYKSLSDKEFSIVAGGDADKSMLLESGRYPVIANALTNDGIIGYYNHSYRIKGPAVTVTGRGDVGYAQARSFSFTPVVRLLAITSPHDVYFFANAINKNKIIRESTGVPQLTTNQLSEHEVPFPSTLKEEKEIGVYFKSLDSMVQGVTKKIASLKQMKQACLVSMFPQAGETKPRVRFKGFKGEWENVSFKDITYLSGTKNKDNLPLESYSISNEKGFVPQNEQFEQGGTMANADKRLYYIVTPDSFAYNPARINVGSIGYDDLDKDVIVSSLYVVFKTDDNTNNYFLNHWFKTPMFRNMIELYQEGGVRLYFFYDKLCQCHFRRPCLAEQEKIASFFTSLDKQISLQEARLEKLKQIKSACLDKMFV